MTREYSKQPRFSVSRLIEAALEKAGTGETGAIDTPGLRALCQSLSDIEEELNFLGRIRAEQLLVETLVKGLRVAHHLAGAPEIGQIPIAPPIFLVAPFRTGTTLLHRLLAQDPAHRAPRLWEALQAPPLEPLYRRDPAYFERDYRIAIARRYMETRERSSGGIAHMHPSGVDLPEECFGLLETSFLSHSFMFYGPVVGYLDWLDERDRKDWVAAYQVYADQIRLLDWWAPGERWVLKTPFHMWAIDAILEVFPGALIVQQHRSPIDCVGSFCSLTAAAYGPMVSRLDKQAIGRLAMRYLGDALARDVAARRRLPPDRFIDVDYRELVQDPIGSARRVYQAIGSDIPPAVERKMGSWLEAEAQTRKGKRLRHTYSLQEFGLQRDEVESLFEQYSAWNPARDAVSDAAAEVA